MLVTLEEIKDMLRVTTTADDELLGVMLTNVHGVLLDYLGCEDLDAYLYATTGLVEEDLYYDFGEDWPATAGLTPITVLRSAIYTALAWVYDNRADSPLTEGVKSVLRRFRAPIVSNAND